MNQKQKYSIGFFFLLSLGSSMSQQVFAVDGDPSDATQLPPVDQGVPQEMPPLVGSSPNVSPVAQDTTLPVQDPATIALPDPTAAPAAPVEPLAPVPADVPPTDQGTPSTDQGKAQDTSPPRPSKKEKALAATADAGKMALAAKEIQSGDVMGGFQDAKAAALDFNKNTDISKNTVIAANKLAKGTVAVTNAAVAGTVATEKKAVAAAKAAAAKAAAAKAAATKAAAAKAAAAKAAATKAAAGAKNATKKALPALSHPRKRHHR
ncbi:MAG: hypothetical protein ACRC12_00310 [Holosporales bacterium]